MKEQFNFAQKCCIFFCKSYRKVFANKPATCRFSPSCSVYFETAVKKHGAIKGFVLGFKRIFRCRPSRKHLSHFDPVPENIKGEFKWLL